MRKLFLLVMALFFFTVSFAITPTQESVKEASNQWGLALKSRDAEKITNLYAKDAFLFATFTNMLDSREKILAYFKNLTQKSDLNVDFNQQNVRLYGNTAINSGLYTFSFTDAEGKSVKVPARYSFVYTLTPQGWLIVEHHSSVLPE